MSHEHAFAVLYHHLGPYGRQDVHVHPCIEGGPGTCWRAVIGPGRTCDGKPETHWRQTLGDVALDGERHG